MGKLTFRPWWQRPLIKLANWWQYGHTEATWGNHTIPSYGPPRCQICGEPVDGHFHLPSR